MDKPGPEGGISPGQAELPWVVTRSGARYEGEWVPGGFKASDGTVVLLDDIATSSVGSERTG